MHDTPELSLLRPSQLDGLFRDLTSLKGVGDRSAATCEKLFGRRLIDVLFHLPYQMIDRSYRPPLNVLKEGDLITAEVTIGAHNDPKRRGLPYRIHCYNSTGEIDLVFFRARGDWLSKSAPEGSERIISGRVDFFRDKPQIVHPDYMLSVDAGKNIPLYEPVYPLTQGLSNLAVRKMVDQITPHIPRVPEWLTSPWCQRQNWPSWSEALLSVHHPDRATPLDALSPARQRLAYDELLANQITLALVRQTKRAHVGQAIPGTGVLSKQLTTLLPFDLTNGQSQAIYDISQDLASPKRMLRLVQGDVGSGKTLVALMAILQTIESNRQAAIMAPTEILATQHAHTIGGYLDQLGVPWVCLTGGPKTKARLAQKAAIAEGDVKLVIGTHALFQDDVVFNDLGLAVVDEQHRFGVKQRLRLGSKGSSGGDATNILVMTATPIPRTLSLVAYGDMDVSRITDKPAGRKPIDTRLMSIDRYEALKKALQRIIDAGDQAYWVCPLVSESDVSDLAAAEDRYADLAALYGDRVGLLHGQMRPDDKARMMRAFQKGEVSVLVATTVIEVGVDVPAATTMIIEHAERFGLAQLHQLRGRVGRGDKPAHCILLYRGPLGEIAKARLNIMRKSQDGFELAEEDLRLRGSGEMLGVRQSGLPSFRLADLYQHAEMLPEIYDDVQQLLAQDPQLTSERGLAIRTLLHIFERGEALRLIEAG